MILVLGLAGSGKSTQCRLLSESGMYQWLSVGQLLRNRVADHGLKAMMDNGDVLEDHIVVPMVESEIFARGDSPELILDGFPRTIYQAEWLAGLHGKGEIKISKIVHLKLSEHFALERLLKRGRSDDHNEAINERFKEYELTILPILNLFKVKGLSVAEIDGTDSIDTVNQNILKFLQNG